MNKPDYEFVRDARQKLGLTQLEFGRRLGIARQSVTRFETEGYRLPEVYRLAIERLLEKRDQHKGQRR